MDEETIKNITQKLDRIISYLDDDEKTGRKGLHRRVSDNEEDIRSLKSDKRYLVGVAAGFSILFTVISLFLSYIFNVFKN